MNKPSSVTLHVAWVVTIVLLTGYLLSQINVVTNIQQFMPSQNQPTVLYELQKEIIGGKDSATILLNIHGKDPEDLVRISRSLKNRFSHDVKKAIVRNGEEGFDYTEIEKLKESRFLLTDTDWSTESLKRAFQARLSDLRQGQGPVIGEMLKTDPFLSIKKYLGSVQSPTKLNENYPVWYSDKVGAILRVEFSAENPELDTIESVISTLYDMFSELSKNTDAKLTVTGPGAIAVATRDEIRSVTQQLSWAIPVLLIVVFWFAYKSVYLVWFSGIPLITGAVLGLTITQVIFSNVHGIVIAFGITLLGVALDYPVHLFSHKYPTERLSTTASRIWPVLRFGGLTSAAAFLVLLSSGFQGLSQLAVYACSGLIVALLITRYLLPAIITSENVHPAVLLDDKVVNSLTAKLILIFLTAAVIFPWIYKDTYWNDNVDAVSPVSSEQKKHDAILRDIIGGQELSDIFIVNAEDLNQVLISTEKLSVKLYDLVKEGIVGAVLPVTDFLPSEEKQEERKAKIPQSQLLKSRVKAAVEQLPFKSSAFKDFIQLAEKSKSKEVVTHDSILKTPLAPLINRALIKTDDGWLSIVRISGLSSHERFSQWLADNPQIGQHHINIKEQVSSLFGLYRERAFSGIYWVIVILAIVVLVHSQSFIISLRIMFPVFLGVTGGLGFGLLAGEGLNIFHLMAVFLVLGMGLDYSLFFNHGRCNPGILSRSFHAVSVSALTTVSLFLFLAFSKIPVLSAMGSVIVAGILLSFTTAFMISRAGPCKQDVDVTPG